MEPTFENITYPPYIQQITGRCENIPAGNTSSSLYNLIVLKLSIYIHPTKNTCKIVMLQLNNAINIQITIHPLSTDRAIVILAFVGPINAGSSAQRDSIALYI